MNEMLPVIRQMHDAADDRGRAAILLSLPDAVLLKHADVFAHACHRHGFSVGEEFVTLRYAAMHAVRDAAGLLPASVTESLDTYRAALARFVAQPDPVDL